MKNRHLSDLFFDLQAGGYRPFLKDGRLFLDGRGKSVPDSILRELRERKLEIIEELKRRQFREPLTESEQMAFQEWVMTMTKEPFLMKQDEAVDMAWWLIGGSRLGRMGKAQQNSSNLRESA